MFTLKIKANHAFTFNFQVDFENRFLKFKTGNKNKDSLNLIVLLVIIMLTSCMPWPVIIMSILKKKNASAKMKFNYWTIVTICILPQSSLFEPL